MKRLFIYTAWRISLAMLSTANITRSLLLLERRRCFATAAASVLSAPTAALSVSDVVPSSSSTSKGENSLETLEPNGLASRLLQRDPNQLKNKVFNAPPGPQVFPEWMRGTWQFQSKFSGYLFPSRKISRERLTQDFVIPGFQKCSIAQTADVGKDSVRYAMKIDPKTGWEDRSFNFKHAIDAYLGYPAVNKVIYDVLKNPNRISIDFNDYRTVNSERIELFYNAREAEEYQGADGSPIFVHSESVRQVTFGTGSTYGVPRQVGTNYGLFWTWKQVNGDELTGNLLTAAYLDPQDSLYFEEPIGPVVVYSNVFEAKRET